MGFLECCDASSKSQEGQDSGCLQLLQQAGQRAGGWHHASQRAAAARGLLAQSSCRPGELGGIQLKAGELRPQPAAPSSPRRGTGKEQVLEGMSGAGLTEEGSADETHLKGTDKQHPTLKVRLH